MKDNWSLLKKLIWYKAILYSKKRSRQEQPEKAKPETPEGK